MSALNWQRHWDPFRDFQREVGRLFESFEPAQHWRVARGVPPINLYDAGEAYILTARLPGVGPDEVDLSITGETLTMRGDRKRPEGVAEETYRRQERQFGRWTPDRHPPGSGRRGQGLGDLRRRRPDRDLAQGRGGPTPADQRDPGDRQWLIDPQSETRP